MKRPLKLILATTAATIAIIGVTVAMPVQTRPQPAYAGAGTSDKYDGDCQPDATVGRCADKPFDHSNCQYPMRWSNPVDGCDNSDPAVPECIKAADTQAGEQACIASFVQEYLPAVPAEKSTVNQCGGIK